MRRPDTTGEPYRVLRLSVVSGRGGEQGEDRKSRAVSPRSCFPAV